MYRRKQIEVIQYLDECKIKQTPFNEVIQTLEEKYNICVQKDPYKNDNTWYLYEKLPYIELETTVVE